MPAFRALLFPAARQVWRGCYLVSWLGTHHGHAVVSLPQQDPESIQLPLQGKERGVSDARGQVQCPD